MQLTRKGEVITPVLSNSVKGVEFECIHNYDSTDFMNKNKFERFILKCTNDVVPMSWDWMKLEVELCSR